MIPTIFVVVFKGHLESQTHIYCSTWRYFRRPERPAKKNQNLSTLTHMTGESTEPPTNSNTSGPDKGGEGPWGRKARTLTKVVVICVCIGLCMVSVYAKLLFVKTISKRLLVYKEHSVYCKPSIHQFIHLPYPSIQPLTYPRNQLKVAPWHRVVRFVLLNITPGQPNPFLKDIPRSRQLQLIKHGLMHMLGWMITLWSLFNVVKILGFSTYNTLLDVCCCILIISVFMFYMLPGFNDIFCDVVLDVGVFSRSRKHSSELFFSLCRKGLTAKCLLVFLHVVASHRRSEWSAW